MNAGIRDADNISWKLHAVLRHGADDAILDSYEAERRAHAEAMIRLSVFNKQVVSTAPAQGDGARRNPDHGADPRTGGAASAAPG
jgi:3-(3-hydroxy-phenyl)propionate hydroxylase